MWRIKSISSKNVCTFQDLHYDVTPGKCTLIFGDNLDNDSQNSNGSGKSALLECISLALTGQTLRDIKTVDNLINDLEEFCEVEAVLVNNDSKEEIIIHRRFDRGIIGQSIILTINNLSDGTSSKHVEATIADYNKYITELIGLNKEEIFSNYILSRQRYNPFLSASDKEKKDIINTFSNGILVDQSIECIHNDLEPLQKELTETEVKTAAVDGAIKTLKETIENTKNNEKAALLSKEEKIKGWRQDIADKRKSIRELSESRQRGESKLKIVTETLYKSVEALENSVTPVAECYEQLQNLLESYSLTKMSLNYAEIISEKSKELNNLKIKLSDNDKKLNETSAKYDKCLKEFEIYKAAHSKVQQKNEEDRNKVDAEIQLLREKLSNVMNELSSLRQERKKCSENISKIEAQLAGVICCPKCHHEFFLDDSKEKPEVLKERLIKEKEQEKKLDTDIIKLSSDEKTYTDDGISKKKQMIELRDQDDKNKAEYISKKQTVSSLLSETSDIKAISANISATISELSNVTQTERKKMFQEVFNTLDEAESRIKKGLTEVDTRISSANGAITILEDNIKAEQERITSNADILKGLEDNLIKNEDKHLELITAKERLEGEISKLKIQESHFNKFKTYLANTKISAIENITNEFLELLGSDLRVVLSGYTTLKSGKIRDKISVTLLRDGVDCGMFQKLSAGEQARIQLANILAMYQLTNQKCSTGKGLDLLVIDEVLDSSDEMGLASVFNALNTLNITSLVVSHGNIAESYEYKLIVQKSGGISKLI